MSTPKTLRINFFFKNFINSFSSSSKGTYVILENLSSSTLLREQLNQIPTVSRVIVEQQNPYVLGGQYIPVDQVRDFRANRLENQAADEDLVAYTVNVPLVDYPLVSPDLLNGLLTVSVPNITPIQQAMMSSDPNISSQTVSDIHELTALIRNSVEDLVGLAEEDLDYATLIYRHIRSINTDGISLSHHLYYLNRNSSESEALNQQLSRFFTNVRGGSLGSRFLNLFLVLGFTFMNNIYTRFSELSLDTSVTMWINSSTQNFLVALRQSLSALSLLFLGIDYFTSINVTQAVVTLQGVIVYLGPILGVIRSYNLVVSMPFSNVALNNAREALNNLAEPSWFQNLLLSLRQRFVSLARNVGSALLGSAAVFVMSYLYSSGYGRHILTIFIQQIWQRFFSGSRNNIPLLESQSDMIQDVSLEEIVGPITRFFREFEHEFRLFLRRFRYI